ncbi:hypothetical protein CDIK_1123 [Cucumispora dikerogammari]|nr:hypothetical protein CDIK_1123 [Cucumispora dikerogammari]
MVFGIITNSAGKIILCNIVDIMTNEKRRKGKTLMSRGTFEQVKRLYKSKTKEEIMEITLLSRSALNVLIRKIESFENINDLTFESVYGKPERKKNNNEAIHVELRFMIGKDNFLILAGCKEKIFSNFSIPQLSRHFKAPGLQEKRLKTA